MFDVENFTKFLASKYSVLTFTSRKFEYDVDDNKYLMFLDSLSFLFEVDSRWLLLQNEMDSILKYVREERIVRDERLNKAVNQIKMSYNVAYKDYDFYKEYYSSECSKLTLEFSKRCPYSNYFEENFSNLRFNPNVIQRLNSWISGVSVEELYKEENEQAEKKLIDRAKLYLHNFEVSDFQVVALLFEKDSNEKQNLYDSLAVTGVSVDHFLSSVNYVINQCPSLIFSEDYGNYVFLDYLLSYLRDEYINDSDLRARIINTLRHLYAIDISFNPHASDIDKKRLVYSQFAE